MRRHGALSEPLARALTAPGGPYAILGPKRLGYDAGISCHGTQMLDFLPELERSFPTAIRQRCPERIRTHPLRREITALEELSKEYDLKREEVIRLCHEQSVPIYHGKIDKSLFAAVRQESTLQAQ